MFWCKICYKIVVDVSYKITLVIGILQRIESKIYTLLFNGRPMFTSLIYDSEAKLIRKRGLSNVDMRIGFFLISVRSFNKQYDRLLYERAKGLVGEAFDH